MLIKTRKMQELEHERGRDIRDILRDAYRDEGGIEKAAEHLGIDTSTFFKWVKDLQGEFHGQYVGEVRFPERDEVAAA